MVEGFIFYNLIGFVLIAAITSVVLDIPIAIYCKIAKTGQWKSGEFIKKMAIIFEFVIILSLTLYGMVLEQINWWLL